MAKSGEEAVAKQACPYEGCEGNRIWFWGWYAREGGSIPLGEMEVVLEPIPLRRFLCCECGRTFSWRPPFLVFRRRLMAWAYELAFRDWVFRRPPRETGWCFLGLAARRAFFRCLNQQACYLLGRLGSHFDDRCPVRIVLWRALRALRRSLAGPGIYRLTAHVLCSMLAQHPDGTRYHPACF